MHRWCFSRDGWPRGWPQWRKSFQVYLCFCNLGLIRGLFQDCLIFHNSLSCFWCRVFLWWALASVFNMHSPKEIKFKFVVCERHLQEFFYFNILYQFALLFGNKTSRQSLIFMCTCSHLSFYYTYVFIFSLLNYCLQLIMYMYLKFPEFMHSRISCLLLNFPLLYHTNLFYFNI